MTNETKHPADARPWHVAVHPENNNIKYIRFDSGEFHKEVCTLYSSNSKANAEHIVKCVNAHDDLVSALREAIDNYVTVVCNEQQCEIDDVLNDPVVMRWTAALKKASE